MVMLVPLMVPRQTVVPLALVAVLVLLAVVAVVVLAVLAVLLVLCVHCTLPGRLARLGASEKLTGPLVGTSYVIDIWPP
jgi:uncharacterized membrane protein